MQREGLCRALLPKGNPTLKTLLAILGGADLRLAVTKCDHDTERLGHIDRYKQN